MKNLILILVAGCVLACTSGCHNFSLNRFDPYADPGADEILAAQPLATTTLTNQIDQQLLQPSTDPFTIGPGDRLEIEFLDDHTSRTLVTVGPDGKIYFHLLPGLDVWGLTISETKDLIEREFSRFLRERPQIGVTLRAVESKRVWLLGRLHQPGVYPMTGQMTLLEALSLAGGTMTAYGDNTEIIAANTEELADLRRAFVIRRGKLIPVDFHRLLKEGDLSQNIYLQPDDFIYLPAGTGREVYVMGGVWMPRAVPYKEELTLTAAIANAGGTIRDAQRSHVAVVRGSIAQPEIAVIDFEDIIKGRIPDVLLEPSDIVYVPLKPYRILKRYVDSALNTFVSSVAINEGSRAVLRRPPPPTGILIPFGSRISVQPPAAR